MNNSYPKRMTLELSDTCNLRCGMCLVHSQKSKSKSPRGLSLSDIERIIKSLGGYKPVIQPTFYGESLLAPEFKEIMTLLKKHGFSIALNTNGTLLDEELCRFFLKIKLDSINISLDSYYSDTYKAIHGVDKLEYLKRIILYMLKIRGNCLTPRIGVSFCRQKCNIDEERKFIFFWGNYVDVVRVNALAHNDIPDTYLLRKVPQKRVPCSMLYETMSVLYNGDVVICCRDAHRRYHMGNIFNEGIEQLWRNKYFSKIRELHETGRWDEIPICSSCNAWAAASIKERERGIFTVRESPLAAYYNVTNRLNGWHAQLKARYNFPNHQEWT